MSWSILVIEDDSDCRESLVQILAARGYRTVGAPDGQVALERVHTEGWRPSLIILDLMMPIMDGHEFLRLQSIDPLLAPVPVVVITASGTRRLQGPGPVAAIVQKPFQLRVLLQTIEEACRGHITQPMAPLPVPTSSAPAPGPSTSATMAAPPADSPALPEMTQPAASAGAMEAIKT